jgi:hypothetical protein
VPFPSQNVFDREIKSHFDGPISKEYIDQQVQRLKRQGKDITPKTTGRPNFRTKLRIQTQSSHRAHEPSNEPSGTHTRKPFQMEGTHLPLKAHFCAWRHTSTLGETRHESPNLGNMASIIQGYQHRIKADTLFLQISIVNAVFFFSLFLSIATRHTIQALEKGIFGQQFCTHTL